MPVSHVTSRLVRQAQVIPNLYPVTVFTVEIGRFNCLPVRSSSNDGVYCKGGQDVIDLSLKDDGRAATTVLFLSCLVLNGCEHRRETVVVVLSWSHYVRWQPSLAASVVFIIQDVKPVSH